MKVKMPFISNKRRIFKQDGLTGKISHHSKQCTCSKYNGNDNTANGSKKCPRFSCGLQVREASTRVKTSMYACARAHTNTPFTLYNYLMSDQRQSEYRQTISHLHLSVGSLSVIGPRQQHETILYSLVPGGFCSL